MFDGEEEIVSSAATRIQSRQDALGTAYPFALDGRGDVLTCGLNDESFGQTAYVLSLVLSNLRALTPVLEGSSLHPGDAEVPRLREYFQFFATAVRRTGRRRSSRSMRAGSPTRSRPSTDGSPT